MKNTLSAYSSIPQSSFLFAKVASTITIILGATALIGWAFYFWLPEALMPLVIALKPNTASCIVLAGIALWIRNEKIGEYSYYLAQICSSFIFLVSILTLFEY